MVGNAISRCLVSDSSLDVGLSSENSQNERRINEIKVEDDTIKLCSIRSIRTVVVVIDKQTACKATISDLMDLIEVGAFEMTRNKKCITVREVVCEEKFNKKDEM